MAPKISFRAAYARYVLSRHVLDKFNKLHGRNETKLPLIDDHDFFGTTPRSPDYGQPICIVGAGPAGLSTSIMLQNIGFTNITVLEASDRIGGRAYTYHFKAGEECNHNYYDVGAMRIPDIDTQFSTLLMIKWLNDNGENVPLANYIYNAGTEPSWYKSVTEDPGFDKYMDILMSKNNFIGPTTEPFDDAFQNFINSSDQPDTYSTRAWLMHAPKPDGPQWTYQQTEDAETNDTSTGLFDQAFMETICDWYDFDHAEQIKAAWYRVDGGMSVLTDALYNFATKKGVKVITKCPVIAMVDNNQTITVTYTGNPQPAPPTEYTAVFNTTTFGCLQRMNLLGLNLSSENLLGIRALSYDRATKVAIKFKSPWWRDLIPDGGVSGTDLCISNLVYPSWDDGPNSAYTIIVSYSWAQDASRMAALLAVNDQECTDPTDPIIQICLRDLATLWSTEPKYQVTFDSLLGLYSAHHAFAWSHDPYTAGGFALFGPGQFEFLYKQFTLPLCGDKFSICGEAVSGHHAWISGAFDSSYNALYSWTLANGYRDVWQNLKKSPFGGGQGENTAELDEKVLRWHLKTAKEQREAKKLGKTGKNRI